MQSAVREYSEQLEGDAIVKRHLDDLFKALLEQNLLRIIKPYSKVEVAHLAKLIALDAATVEREVSQMILDKKIAGAAPCAACALARSSLRACERLHGACSQAFWTRARAAWRYSRRCPRTRRTPRRWTSSRTWAPWWTRCSHALAASWRDSTAERVWHSSACRA